MLSLNTPNSVGVMHAVFTTVLHFMYFAGDLNPYDADRDGINVEMFYG
jgi:hypothetical protein